VEVPIPEAANEPAPEAAPDPAAEASPAEEASSSAGAPEDGALAGLPPHPSLSPGGGEGNDRHEEPSPAPSEDEEKGEGSAEAAPGGGEGGDAKGEGGRLEAAIASLLSGRQGPPDRVAPIVDLLLDPAPEVSAAAREALAERRAHPSVKPVPERLRRGLLSGIGERPVLAALALGALRDVESIPILIQAFEGGSPEGARAASEALTRITLQRLGPSPQKWLRWWKENRGHSRAEWLFAALTSEEADLRGAAADELRAAGAPPVHYTADLPASELAAAARAWWTWWSHQGLKV